MGIIERIGSLAGTELAKAADLAHETFQDRLGVHGHTGRALVESIAEMCRNHPNLVGIAVGVAVEQLLVHEKHHHDLEVAEQAAHPDAAPADAAREHLLGGARVPLRRPAPHHTPHHLLRFSRIHPSRIAMEVFGALVLLKFTTGMARVFSRRKAHEHASIASVARIRLFSAAFAAYFIAKGLKTHEVSALRNGLAVFFATRALKPLLRPDYRPEAAAPATHVEPTMAAETHEPGFGLTSELHPPPEQDARLFH